MAGNGEPPLLSLLGLVLLGLGVLLATRLLYARRAEQAEDAIYLLLKVMGRVMIVIGLAGVVFGLVLFPFAVLLALATGVVWLLALARYRMSQQASLIQFLQIVTARAIALPPALAAFADEWPDAYGRRVRWLAETLRNGVGLSHALRLWGPVMPRRARLLVDLGSEAGVLTESLAEAVRQQSTPPSGSRAMTLVWYIFGGCFAFYSILTYLAFKIVPSLLRIYEDFNLDLPPPTVLVIVVCGWIDEFALAWFVSAALALSMVLAWTAYYLGWAAWEPPLLNRLTRHLDQALVLRGLAVLAQTGHDPSLGLSIMAKNFPGWRMRRRLAAASADARNGCPWRESMLRRNLIGAAEANLIQAAIESRNLPWALREAATGLERRFRQRSQAILEVLVPFGVVCAGIVVMYVVAGLFLPLAKLITILS